MIQLCLTALIGSSADCSSFVLTISSSQIPKICTNDIKVMWISTDENGTWGFLRDSQRCGPALLFLNPWLGGARKWEFNSSAEGTDYLINTADSVSLWQRTRSAPRYVSTSCAYACRICLLTYVTYIILNTVGNFQVGS